MKLRYMSLNFVVNFLIGISWGYIIVVILTSFPYIFEYSIYTSLLSIIISILPSLISILFLEYFLMSKEKIIELKKQTTLLQQLVDKTNK